jgi:hypothetical protein
MPLDGADPLPAPPKAGCLYLLDDRRPCGCSRQSGSSYCAPHHTLCHLVRGSRAELSHIAEIETAARFVGARIARKSLRIPPTRFMRALEERLRKRP